MPKSTERIKKSHQERKNGSANREWQARKREANSHWKQSYRRGEWIHERM